MRSIPGFEDYLISGDGDVYTLRGVGRYLKPRKSPLLMKTQIMPNGYAAVYLRGIDGARHTCYIHRLVALTYLSPSNLPEVNHKDSIKLHNHHSNLEWVSSLTNMRHMIESGNSLQAIPVTLRNGKQKVTGQSAAHVARLAGISKGSVMNLKSGKRTEVNGWAIV